MMPRLAALGLSLALIATAAPSQISAQTAVSQGVTGAANAVQTQPRPPQRRIPEPPYRETVPPSPGDLTVWPRGASPQEVGKALAEHFINDQATRFSGYPMVCTWYGAL